MKFRIGIPSWARGSLAFCALLLIPAAALAQAGRGSISGTVTDPAGALIPGASITLLNQATGVEQHTVTTSAGLYSFVSLNPGEYQVTATHAGFVAVALKSLIVNIDQVTEANIRLQVGAATETVTVSGLSDLVEPSNSTVGTLIDSAAIDRVPLLYRNVFDLAQLSAGVTPPNGSPNSSDSMQSIQNISVGRPGIDISAATINGAIVGSVYYMLDGSPIGVPDNTSANIMPAMNIPEDGIDEVQVETQNTPASYPSGAAGVISMVSKSGTNRFHGDVFGVFRPDVLSANEYFNKQTELSSGTANTPPDFYRYQEGAALGGPIRKDKLFFFSDYEATQQEQFEGIDYFSVPTNAERTGDFSAMNFTIYDPTQPDYTAANAPNSSLVGTRQPFAGNKIANPNPIGLLFLSKMPACNLPSPTSCETANSDVVNNYGLPGMDPYRAQRFDIRADWVESEKQRIFTRFSFDHLFFATANVFPSGWDLNYAQNTTNGRNILVADDLTLNPSTFLQLRYSFTRHYENQGGPASYSNNDITQQGFPASLASQVIQKQIPIIIFNDVGGGVGGTADGNIFRFSAENSDANIAITKVKGKHQISAGFDWMKQFLNSGQPSAPAGAYGFDVTATDQTASSFTGGSDYASFLIGMGMEPGNESGIGYPNFSKDIAIAMADPYYAAFVEDTYRATRTLTITAGLRWDIFGGRTERHNRQEYFDPTAANTFDGVSYTGAEIFANSGNRSSFTTNLHDLGPRLGFAWQPVTHLVVRGGAGIYYGPSTHMVMGGINADGFNSSTDWNSTCYNADGNTIFYSSSCSAPAAENFTVPYSVSNPFPNGTVPVFTSAPAGLANNLGIALSAVLHSQRTPTTYNYNFGLEYELPHQVVLSVGYVGSRGLFLPFNENDLNQLDLATIQKYNYSLCIVTGPGCAYAPNTWEPIEPSTNANYGAATVPLWAAIEPFPQFGNGSYGAGNGININAYPAGDSEYSSLQTKVQKRLTSHFTTLATFTWGKIMTDDGNPPLNFIGTHNGAAQDWKDLYLEHSISPQDVKYQFSGEASYDLPVGKGQLVDLNGFSNAALGGWTVNAIDYLSTGVPINSPTAGLNPSYFDQRADMTCNPASHAPHTVAAWFNDNCFAIPGTENGGTANPFIPGTAPAYLDHVRTKGARDLDLSLFKTLKFRETKALRFDASAYNLSNTPQFGYPNVPTIVGAVSQGLPFGLITNTINTPRQYQFGARFTF